MFFNKKEKKMLNKKNNLSVIVLGAGKGTRMNSETTKVLHKIANLEILNHTIMNAEKLNFEELSVVASDENYQKIFDGIASFNYNIVIQKEVTGTATAVNYGIKGLKDKNKNNILIMYADTPLIKEITYKRMLEELDNSDASVVVLGFEKKDIGNKYGRLVIKNSYLEEIVEYKDANEEQRNNTLCNAGVVAVKAGLLENLLEKVNNNNASKEFYLTDIVKINRENGGRCKAIIGEEEEMIGINSQLDLADAERIFQNRKRKEFMEKGVTLLQLESVYFSYDTEMDNNVVIEPNVTFLNGVKIKKHCIIKSFSYLEGCILEEGVVVGPFARIRPDTIINSGARVGNFVEIKKSIIGKNTKIGHLTYIGDTKIGENTNIGAGTITCNYDGFSKFKTEIGNDCFVGSNSILVAPIKLGDGAITAAGSVIFHSVEENCLAITRTEQRNLLEKAGSYREKRRGNILTKK